MITVSTHTKTLSHQLQQAASKKAHFFPVDRAFLENYLDQIKGVDPREFIKYNLEHYPNLYATQLLVCLPELWEELSVDDLLEIVDDFKHPFAYYGMILLTYKYLQLDLLPLILHHSKLSEETKADIRDFLKHQYHNLLLFEDDLDDFTEECLGIGLDSWLYTRQRLLLDPRIGLAKQNVEDLKAEIEKI